MDEQVKHFLAYAVEEKAAINEERRSVRFVISSAELDRDNEIVEVAAVAGAIKDFARNPVCLACHQHRLAGGNSPVVGSWDTDSFKAFKKHSEMDLVFAKTELGEEYWSLYRDRHMRAVSIGFAVKDGHEEQKDGTRWYVITKIELYEISCVPVGANRDALSKLKAYGEWIDDADRSKAIEERITKALRSDIDALREEVEILKSKIIDDPGDLAKTLLGLGGDEALDAGCEHDTAERLKRISDDIRELGA